MAIKIQTQQSYIPVYLGDLEMRFDISDDSLLKLQNGAEKVQRELLSINKGKNDEEALKQMKEVLKKGYDFLFGEGTFDKVYDLSPSVVIVTEYFEKIVEALFKELDKRGFSDSMQKKAQKYLQSKNYQNRNRNNRNRKK